MNLTKRGEDLYNSKIKGAEGSKQKDYLTKYIPLQFCILFKEEKIPWLLGIIFSKHSMTSSMVKST